MKIADIKTRSKKPNIPSDLKTIESLTGCNSIIKGVDCYFDDQSKAYNELKALHSNSEQDIITISGIYSMAVLVENDLEWANDNLTSLLDRKRELIEENRSQIEDYEFKAFVKPAEK